MRTELLQKFPSCWNNNLNLNSLYLLNQLYPHGQKNIEAFVKAVGSYLSFCAGSIYAGQQVEWAEESSDPSGALNLGRDYIRSFNFGAPNLFPGGMIGPMGWVPWKVKGTQAPATELAR
jgi:hypothetical protein